MFAYLPRECQNVSVTWTTFVDKIAGNISVMIMALSANVAGCNTRKNVATCVVRSREKLR